MLKNHRVLNKFRLLRENLKLANKFTLLLMLVFLGSIMISGAILSNILNHRAEVAVITQADDFLQSMNSVRNYTTNNIIPLLESKLETSPAFIPETVASFSARAVFENIRTNEQYKEFIYKEAALDPTNKLDQADSFESQLINLFSNNPETSTSSGFRSLPTGRTFYIARRLNLDNPSCLQCHSTPDKAPKSQLAIYGDKNGFGWQLHKTIFAQMIYVPAEKILRTANHYWWLAMGVQASIFALVIIVINILLKKAVIKPIIKISKLAQAVSTGKINTDFEQKTNDEIGTLAASFNRMKSSLEIAMKLLNQKNQK
ncbi:MULTISPECIES: DUF3365 domain-containing protein [unclassified Nostoc]|uniref:c-type heme family protein n=1 Tax=unclassified Nostoc TaxID=2593658 RepID=UPI001F554C1A|nr:MULTISPECIES: DUF3365 domain-containing protein [unclassified Nostoc]